VHEVNQCREEGINLETIGATNLCSAEAFDSLGRERRKSLVAGAASCEVDNTDERERIINRL
jgi:hypothetical protein